MGAYEAKFDWATARNLGVAGAVAGGASKAGFLLLHSQMLEQHAGAGAVVAAWAAAWMAWAGGGAAVLLLVAVLGWALIGLNEVVEVVVGSAGVSGRRKWRTPVFARRDEIVGYDALAAFGPALLGRDSKVLLRLPRSLRGYSDCVAEIRDLGIPMMADGAAAGDFKRQHLLYGALAFILAEGLLRWRALLHNGEAANGGLLLDIVVQAAMFTLFYGLGYGGWWRAILGRKGWAAFLTLGLILFFPGWILLVLCGLGCTNALGLSLVAGYTAAAGVWRFSWRQGG